MIVTTYRAGIDYPAGFNKIIFGRLFMSHYMTVFDYENNGRVLLYPKQFSVDNNFIIHETAIQKYQKAQIVFYVLTLLISMFLLCICYYIRRRAPNENSIRGLQSGEGSRFKHPKNSLAFGSNHSYRFEDRSRRINGAGSGPISQYSLNDYGMDDEDQVVASLKYSMDEYESGPESFAQ